MIIFLGGRRKNRNPSFFFCLKLAQALGQPLASWLAAWLAVWLACWVADLAAKSMLWESGRVGDAEFPASSCAKMAMVTHARTPHL